ncbi:MAG TPA: hypothetical protein VFY99_05975 [Solirubrobacterales bacterium]
MVAGCGDDSESDSGGDPEAVAKAFIEALADEDPGACDLMTADGADFAATMVDADSCEAAIEDAGVFGAGYFFESPPDELPDELDSGVLEERGENTYFQFCLPNESEVKLDLVEVEGEWRIDLVSVSRGEEVDGRDRTTIPPCSLA